MNVKELCDRIVELSHQPQDNPDSYERAFSWLNAAYAEIMNEILVVSPRSLCKTQTVKTNAQGYVQLDMRPFALVKVVFGGADLPIVSPLFLLEADPAQTTVGEPQLVCATFSGVQVQPRKEVCLNVNYIPQPEMLTENDDENKILLPPEHHNALVWGALVWGALFERGFNSENELQLFRRQWCSSKHLVKLCALSA